jgi:hypothetical protein
MTATKPSTVSFMRTTRQFSLALACAALTLAAACHDDTAPRPTTTNFDAAQALTKVRPLTTVVDQNIVHSFDRALTYFEQFIRSAPSVSSGSLKAPSGFDARLARALTPVASIRADAIPADSKGKTFVYDVGTNTYVVDPSATGAPASGVRFVLYAWGEGQVTPPLPLTRVGYADIAPVGPGTGTTQLTEVAVVRDAPRLTVADFVVMHATNGAIDDFGIDGTATDGTTTVDVALDGTHTVVGGNHQLLFNVALSSSSLGVSAREQLTFDQVTASQGGRLDLTYDGHTFSDEAAASGSGRDLRFDGDLYARVIFANAPADELQYLRPDGTSLTQQEIEDLNALLEPVVVANFFWIYVAWP